MATGDGLTSAKAVAGAWMGAAVGFFAPGAAYLLTVDNDGISGTEWLHGGLISLVAAAASSAAVGFVVHQVENKPKEPGL